MLPRRPVVYKSNSQRAPGVNADTAHSALLLYSKAVSLTINIAGNLEHPVKICQQTSYFSVPAQSWSASSSAVLLYWAEGSKQISFACDVRNDACARSGTENLSYFLQIPLYFAFQVCSSSARRSLRCCIFWPALIQQRMMRGHRKSKPDRIHGLFAAAQADHHSRRKSICQAQEFGALQQGSQEKNPFEWRGVKVEKLKVFSPKPR